MVGVKYRQGKGCGLGMRKREKETGDDIKITAMEEMDMNED